MTGHLLASCTIACPHCSTARVIEAEVPVLSVQIVADIDFP
ncbi:hypothetical protein [Nonomuraea sp. NPDC049129]